MSARGSLVTPKTGVLTAIIVLAVIASGVAVVAARGGDGSPANFWDGLQSSEPAPDGELIYSDLAQIQPGGPGAGPLLPADIVVRGVVRGIEPGIGYGNNGDTAEGVVVPFDSSEAITRWGRLTIQVEQVLAGEPSRDVSSLQIAWEIPREADLDQLNALAGEAGEGIFYLSPGADRLKKTGKPVPDEKFYGATYLVVGSAAFVEDGATREFTAPLLDEADRATVTKGAKSLDEIAARLART